IPHGLANAVFLPVVMEAIPELYLPKAKLLAQALGIYDHGQGNEALLVKSIERIRQLRDDIGLPADFADYPMTEEQ
ncbi:iron-containing alcohol dehydrogenase, partial [Anoxybacillus sp. LAT_11]